MCSFHAPAESAVCGTRVLPSRDIAALVPALLPERLISAVPARAAGRGLGRRICRM